MNPKIYRILYIAIGVMMVSAILTAYNIGFERGYNDALDVTNALDVTVSQEIVDQSTGCTYMLFDDMSITPWYNSNGEVKGCKHP